MPVSPINFPMLGMDQTNPEFAGGRFMSDMMTQALQQRLASLTAQKERQLMPFVRPQAEANLQKIQQENQYNPRLWESQLKTAGQEQQKASLLMPYVQEAQRANIALNKAHTQLFGSEAKQKEAMAQKERKLLPFTEEIARTGIDLNKAHTQLFGSQAKQQEALAQKELLMQQLAKHFMGQGNSQPISQQNQSSGYQLTSEEKQRMANMQPGDQLVVGQNQMPQQQQDQKSQPQLASSKSGLDYPGAAFLSHYLGMPAPQILDIDGKRVAVTPWGNIEVAQGLTPGEKSYEQKSGEQLSGLEDLIAKEHGRQITYGKIADILKSPAFEKMRITPIGGKYELSAYAAGGTPEEKRLVGNFIASTGQVVKDAAQDFKGQFRIGEQALVESMKVNANDTIDVARGKMEALMTLTEMLTQRAEIEANLRHEKVPRLKAMKMAEQAVNSQQIIKQVKDKLHPIKKVIDGKTYYKSNGKWVF